MMRFHLPDPVPTGPRLRGRLSLVLPLLTLVAATAIQTLCMGAYFAWHEREALVRVGRAWRVSVWVGLAGMLASAGWFTAMTLERAAYVRALGQIELLFTFAATIVFFRERVRAGEVAGSVLVVAGLVLLLM